MLRPLHKQLGNVTKLAKLMSRSRMNTVDLLVDAHSTFDTIEDMVKRTKEEVSGKTLERLAALVWLDYRSWGLLTASRIAL